MGMEEPQEAWQALDTLSARIEVSRRRAETTGDDGEVVRLRAMEEVIKSRLVALVCPDAVFVAGEAALAAYEGQAEPEWYAQAYARRATAPEQRAELNTAVRLLKSARLWPWPRAAS
jgi:hypothetical protein